MPPVRTLPSTTTGPLTPKSEVDEILTRVNASDLKPGYIIYGNKGNCWNDTAHIYKAGTGNLCGTPALATNWAQIHQMKGAGCPICLVRYKHETYEAK